jgi:hypothetical protein
VKSLLKITTTKWKERPRMIRKNMFDVLGERITKAVLNENYEEAHDLLDLVDRLKGVFH